VIEGLASSGVEVIDLGVLPTPGVAFVAAELTCPGFVVSASHNPYRDNGIKVLGPGGTKLSTDQEEAIEAVLHADVLDDLAVAPGALRVDASLVEHYLDHVVDAVGGGALDGMKIVLDCAHGASTVTAPLIFERLGADVVVVGNDPNGTNINDSVGSTHPEMLAEVVRTESAHLGLAFDGDADRLVAVDHQGGVVPGDALIALFAIDLAERGALTRNAVVVTVMSNLGFHRAMERAGIAVRVVAVGDRNVVEAIDAEDLTLGGEQSGHIIFRSLASTGDGVLTGVLLADLLARQQRSLHELSNEILTLVPQYLNAVPIHGDARVADAEDLWRRVQELEGELGETGRILVRASGTEPVVRVMVEADDDAQARAIVDELTALVAATLGASG
jgi:phosphoglucosamine mutase